MAYGNKIFRHIFKRFPKLDNSDFVLFLTLFIFFDHHCNEFQLFHSANLFTDVGVI